MSNSRPIRIAYLIDNLRLAGTQTVLLNLAEGLAERGVDQRLFCLNDLAHPQNLARLTACGVETHIYSKAEIILGAGPVKIYREIRRWKPDIVQTFLPIGDLVGRTIGRIAKVPSIVTSIRARNIDKPLWNRWLDRRTMGWADRVVFNSHTVVSFSQAHEGVTKAQTVVIPNGVSPPKPADGQSGGLSRTLKLGSDGNRNIGDLALPPESLIVGTIGRIKPQKGQLHLIRALPLVVSAFPTVELLVVGTGFMQGALEAEAKKLGVGPRVHFLGERTDIPEILRSLDLYAHPALFEGMPNVVMEAMAASLPVVATDVDGAAELIEHGRTGWLVSAGDSEALSRQIVSILSDPESAERVGRTAARYMQENFSLPAMVEAFFELYSGLVRGDLAG